MRTPEESQVTAIVFPRFWGQESLREEFAQVPAVSQRPGTPQLFPGVKLYLWYTEELSSLLLIIQKGTMAKHYPHLTKLTLTLRTCFKRNEVTGTKNSHMRVTFENWPRHFLPILWWHLSNGEGQL